MSIIEKLEITPGPWQYDEYVGTDEYDDPNEPFLIVGDVEWHPNKVDIPSGLDRAHEARLMSSAPEMLEALIENMIFHLAYDKYMHGQDKDMDLDNNRIGFKTMEIIEKATGKTWDQVRTLIEELRNG